MKPAARRLLIQSTKEHEGFRSLPYPDTAGHLTIGYGLNLDAGMTEEEAEAILVIRLCNAETSLIDRYTWFSGLSDTRQRSLIEMHYQLGSISVFRRMIRALRAGNYDKAAAEMLDSQWNTQTPTRAAHCAALMREG